MSPVGRPRTSTDIGRRAPTTELGIPDLTPTVSSMNPLTGRVAPWSELMDVHEYVPELTWPNNIPVYDQMRTDSQLAALWTALTYGIMQLRFVIDPNSARPEIVQGISEDLNLPIQGKDDEPRRRMKRRFAHGKHLYNTMLATMYGHMFYEQVGEIIDGKWRLRKLAPRMPHSISAINVAEDGGLVSIRQYSSGFNNKLFSPAFGQTPEIPVDRLVAFPFQQEGQNWFGRSLFRDCYKNWLIKDKLMRVDAINHERAGGIPYAEAAPGMNTSEIEELNLLMQQFRTGDMAGTALPHGTMLKIAKGTGSDVVKSWAAHDEAMARRFLLMLMNLAQGSQNVGSYALSENFNDTFVTAQRFIVQWYCDIMTEHVIEDWVDWNYGEAEELTPVMTWERNTEDALGIDQFGMMVEKKMIVVDDQTEDWFRYRYKMPRRSRPRAEIIQEQAEAETVSPPAGEQTGEEAAVGAPSRSTNSPVQASGVFDWEQESATMLLSNGETVLFGEPHVMASSKTPVLVTLANVPIMEAGVEYRLSTGLTTFTPEDLRDVVGAANEDFAIPNPRLKLGHVDPRYNSSPYDATPSFGKAINLRLSENGMTVYCDYAGVPKWLADVMATAYPNKSIEGFWNVESQSGKQWRFVLSAVALLGVVWPGITNLEDLPQLANYYGEDMPADVQIVEATTSATGGDPVKTAASANLDDIRRAFYNDFVPANSAAQMWWVRAVLTDPNQLVVEDDNDGQLYLIPFESDSQGIVEFGTADPVRIDYVPDGRESKKAAASHVAAAIASSRTVLATYATREESGAPDEDPETQGGAMDPKQIRQQLNLPEDASDEQVREALSSLTTAVGLTAPATQEGIPGTDGSAVQEGTGLVGISTGGSEPENPADPPVPTAERAVGSAATGAFTAPAGTVLVDENMWKESQAVQARLATRLDAEEVAERERQVDAAIGDGRIPTASRPHWLLTLEKDPNGAATLASLAPGLIPVELREIGNGLTGEGAEAQATADQVTGWTRQLFPDTAQKVELEAKVAASGGMGYPRIMSDVDPRLQGVS